MQSLLGAEVLSLLDLARVETEASCHDDSSLVHSERPLCLLGMLLPTNTKNVSQGCESHRDVGMRMQGWDIPCCYRLAELAPMIGLAD